MWFQTQPGSLVSDADKKSQTGVRVPPRSRSGDVLTLNILPSSVQKENSTGKMTKSRLVKQLAPSLCEEGGLQWS